MKKDTLKLLKENLSKENNNNMIERRRKSGYTYRIENIPILVERNKDGRVGEITFPEVRIIYEAEND